MTQRKTKIICTLGPASWKENILRALMENGMNVARINFSHADYDFLNPRIELFKKLRAETGMPVALLADTKGPEVRLGMIPEGKVILEDGKIFTLTTKQIDGNADICSVSYDGFARDMKKGAPILIDDGLIELCVESTTETDLHCRVIHGGPISSRKGVNVPGTKLNLPYLSSRDRADLRYAVENGFDFVAASFVYEAKNVREVRAELSRLGGQDIRIIAKIENAEGVANIDEILEASDGIMVARGDMGVEIPMEELPVIQKLLITRSYSAGKQVITATQMLESMINHPRPTRAECTDIANAIYDGTSAIMLSGETAAGQFPLESCTTMARIALRTERDIDYQKRFRTRTPDIDMGNITNAISHATCSAAHDLSAAGIITVTKSGETAKMISKFRPDCPIIGCSPDERVVRQMNLSWGVTPLWVEEQSDSGALFEASVQAAKETGCVVDGDLVVITAGMPLGVSGTTNMLHVNVVGERMM